MQIKNNILADNQNLINALVASKNGNVVPPEPCTKINPNNPHTDKKTNCHKTKVENLENCGIPQNGPNANASFKENISGNLNINNAAEEDNKENFNSNKQVPTESKQMSTLYQIQSHGLTFENNNINNNNNTFHDLGFLTNDEGFTFSEGYTTADEASSESFSSPLRSNLSIGSSKRDSSSTNLENEIDCLKIEQSAFKKVNLYKTELCRSWEEKGICRYELKCQFAHGRDELRSCDRHPKFKSEICRTFWMIGTCPYGRRCCFIHNEFSQEKKKKEIKESNREEDINQIKPSKIAGRFSPVNQKTDDSHNARYISNFDLNEWNNSR